MITDENLDQICVLLYHARIEGFMGQLSGPPWHELDLPEREEIRAEVRGALDGDHPIFDFHRPSSPDTITLPESEFSEID
jgi:hypothetical protein